MQNPQKFTLFQKKDLNFAISKFSKYCKHTFFYKLIAQLEDSLRKKFQKNKNTEIEIEAKNQPKSTHFQTLANRY